MNYSLMGILVAAGIIIVAVVVGLASAVVVTTFFIDLGMSTHLLVTGGTIVIVGSVVGCGICEGLCRIKTIKRWLE